MLHNAQIVGFAEGTPVLMADGTWRPIEKIKNGDWIMSFNPNVENSELEPRKVMNTFSALHRDCIEVFANGKITIVAKDQLFFTPGANWESGYDTKQVMDFAGNRQDIKVRRVRGGKFQIYDVIVDETHSLIANDLRVHNGGGSRRKKKVVVQAPQPVVTAGKPGKPVSVTTTYNGNTTTVVVNPSPGSSGQVSVGASGTVTVRQNSVPGLPVSDNTTYQPPVFLPYPGGSYVYDRAINAEILRSSVCDNMQSKGSNYRVTSKDEQAWESEIDSMINELQSIKDVNVSRGGPHRRSIQVDPSLINDAIRNANDLKKEIRAGRRLTRGIIESNCNKIAGIIDRISRSVRPGNGNDYVCGTVAPPVVVCPGPSTYHTSRIYEDDANYGYMLRLANTCDYVFDPPNAPADTKIRYFKHWDPFANKYYYDRVSADAICTTAGGRIDA